ncbi:MAG TPA: C39 family peptidase [Terriglobales bacterium]|nr:C39 family peptidase [Terriglobales bacterium]
MRWPVPLILVLCAVCAQAQAAHWLDVPFVKQPADGCGAASIAMVMQYWDQKPSEASEVAHIQQVLFSTEARGIQASEMQRYLGQNGYRTFVFSGDQALLEHHIGRGRPLIVALKPGSESRLHYVVVAGVDPTGGLLLVNDPAQRKLLKLDLRTFEHEWQATGNWTLLAVPQSSTQ